MTRSACFTGLTAFWVALAGETSLTRAEDLYVSVKGDDSNRGTQAEPYRTITQAYRKASAGDTIRVLPGVYCDYSSRWGIRLRKTGTASRPIVLRSEIPGQAVVDGENQRDRNQGFYIDGDYNVVEGFEIRNCPNGGISIWGNGNRIIGNDIHHNGTPSSASTNGKDGVYSNEGTKDNYYAGNSIHDNGRKGSNLDHGLYLCGQNEMVLNNVLFRNAATGLQIAGYRTVRNMKVYNNVMAWNGTSGIVLWQKLKDVEIKNNILYRNGHWGIGSWKAHGSGVVVDHNLACHNGDGDYNFTHGDSDYECQVGTKVTGEPLFVKSSREEFDAHLCEGSPAIGAGVNLHAVFDRCKDRVARAEHGPWDLGAFSFRPRAKGQ